VTVSGTRSDGRPLTDTYPAGSTTITWTATDAAGQTASCQQTIKVRTLADLQTVIDPLINPAQAGQFLTYRFEAINGGPSPALGVRMTDTLANDVAFISVVAGPDVAGCSFNPTTRVVSCEMGRIDQATAKYALLSVRPQFPGLTINQATLGVDPMLTFDPNPGNNTFIKYTTVIK
jgi:uncharacterized repeat protein (TIGR01451 family)